MQNLKRSMMVMSFLLLILTGIFVVESNGQTQPKSTGTVMLSNSIPTADEKGEDQEVYVLATLFKAGKPVRSVTIHNKRYENKGIEGAAQWNDLQEGTYEVHFEATGYGKVIKHLVVTANASTTVVIDALGKRDEVWGGGPTLQELEKKLQKL